MCAGQSSTSRPDHAFADRAVCVTGGDICSGWIPLHVSASLAEVFDSVATAVCEALVEGWVLLLPRLFPLLVVVLWERCSALVHRLRVGRSSSESCVKGSCHVLRVALFALRVQCLLPFPRAARGGSSLHFDASAGSRSFRRQLHFFVFQLGFIHHFMAPPGRTTFRACQDSPRSTASFPNLQVLSLVLWKTWFDMFHVQLCITCAVRVWCLRGGASLTLSSR